MHIGIFLTEKTGTKSFSCHFTFILIYEAHVHFPCRFYVTVFCQPAFRFAIHSVINDKPRCFQLIFLSIKVCPIKGGFGNHWSVECNTFVFSCITSFLASLSLHCQLSVYRTLHSLTLEPVTSSRRSCCTRAIESCTSFFRFFFLFFLDRRREFTL